MGLCRRLAFLNLLPFCAKNRTKLRKTESAGSDELARFLPCCFFCPRGPGFSLPSCLFSASCFLEVKGSKLRIAEVFTTSQLAAFFGRKRHQVQKCTTFRCQREPQLAQFYSPKWQQVEKAANFRHPQLAVFFGRKLQQVQKGSNFRIQGLPQLAVFNLLFSFTEKGSTLKRQ